MYGYGRKPSYFQWSVPLDYHLFRCRRDPALRKTPSAGRSEIAVARSDSLNPAGKPLTVALWINAEKDDGVILARGGASHGYGLILSGGKPAFMIRIANRLHKVEAEATVTGRWVHLAGALTKAKQLQVFIDGQLCASAEAPDFIKADPSDKMDIGTDRGSPLGEYKEAPPFMGRIDEVRIYHRALTPQEVKQQATGNPTQDTTGLVLYYSFDRGDAQDDSGNENHGGVGAVPAEGKFGQGMAFDAGVSPKQGGPSRVSRHFQHQWSHDCPIHVRAMALTGKGLFVAGPPDVLDEEEAYRRPHDDDILKQLAEQDAASNGLRGGLLLAVSPVDGKELARCRLSSPPAWDSMAAVAGRLYFTTMDGHVVCMRDK